MESDKARLTAEIPKELMRRVRIRAAETDREIREIVVEALEQFLSGRPKKGGK
jgi:predicted transcriptional regulator